MLVFLEGEKLKNFLSKNNLAPGLGYEPWPHEAFISLINELEITKTPALSERIFVRTQVPFPTNYQISKRYIFLQNWFTPIGGLRTSR